MALSFCGDSVPMVDTDKTLLFVLWHCPSVGTVFPWSTQITHCCLSYGTVLLWGQCSHGRHRYDIVVCPMALSFCGGSVPMVDTDKTLLFVLWHCPSVGTVFPWSTQIKHCCLSYGTVLLWGQCSHGRHR